MNFAKIRKYDVSNWEGINTTIFFSGCTFDCPGCFNKEAHDFNYGGEFTKDIEDKFIEYANDKRVSGVCILGGEVFQQDLDAMYNFIRRIYLEVRKPIHVWTGYKFEHLLYSDKTVNILKLIDTLVDGQFEIDKKDLSLKYRGSSNQRVIDVVKTLHYGKVYQIK